MSSSSSTSKVFKIIPTTQNYDWGKIGRNAKVAQFAEASRIPGFEVNDETPYAELWMGTHPSSPSHVWDTNELLSVHLVKHPDLIGPTILQKFGANDGNLPFLFKVLSIQKALSIQSHPDKRTAEALHAQLPNIYKDPNHKPEMAIALTPFQALCGFRPLPQIAHNLQTTPELASLIPSTILSSFYDMVDSPKPGNQDEKVSLKNLFASLMSAKSDKVKQVIEEIVQRYQREPSDSDDIKSLKFLVLRLQTQFPYDIGILCAYLLNFITLSPGSAIFLGAGEPHAYISGECIECMANSDNVIRAGLTPKLRDVPNLVAGLTYDVGEGTRHYVQPKEFGVGGKSVLYDPPIDEFSVVRVELKNEEKDVQREVGGPGLAVVTAGTGVVEWRNADEGKKHELKIGLGDVFFIGAGTEITLSAFGEGVLQLFRAFVEVQ